MIGQKIKKWRNIRHLTQEELAAKAKVNRGHLSSIEADKYPNPGVMTLQAIADALKVSLDDLLGRKSKGRIVPLPVISKAVGSPAGAFFTDQDFPAGAANEYYEVDDPNAFVLIVEGDSMEPTVRAGDRIIVTPNKKYKPGDICVVRLAQSGKTFLKRVESHGSDVILKSDNPRYEIMVYKSKEIGFIYRVEAIIPK